MLAITICVFSCKKSGYDEGTILFDIQYLEEEKKTKPVINLLPVEMTQIYKNMSSKSMIEGFMGMFLTAYISDVNDKSHTIIFKVMADKYYCKTKFGEPALGFDDMPGMKIEKTKETKMFGKNIKAYKAKVSFPGKSIDPYDIYYTKDIKIDNPNWNNPYKEIDGVLLEFKVILRGITMNVKAREIKQQQIDEVEFAIPDDFKMVDSEKLNKIVDKYMTNTQ